MPLLKEKNLNKKVSSKPIITVKESGYAKVTREGRERRAKEEQKQKDKELADITEEKRLEKIVMPYLDNLEAQLLEKEADDFWTFPDRVGFGKIKNVNFDQMQKFIKEDIPKYADRKICYIDVYFLHNEPITSIYRRSGILLIVTIKVYHIDDKGILNGKYITNISAFNWKLRDFAITKITFKLLEAIMFVIVNNQYQSVGFSGLPLPVLLKALKRKKVDISDALIPLAGY